MPEIHLLSGGVDSTSVLSRRLMETQEEIHVVHVRAGHAAKGPYETDASRQIAIWLVKNVRSLVYSEIIFNAGKLHCANGLFAICGLSVGQYLIKHPYISTVVQGTNGGDADQSEDSLARNRYREAVCAAVCDGYAPAPQWISPHAGLAKLDAYRLMPPELRKMCVTCLFPSRRGAGYVACGKCQKCLELKAVKVAAR